MGRSGNSFVRTAGGLLIAGALIVAIGGTASAATPIGNWKLKGNLKNSTGTALKMLKVGDTTFETVDVNGRSRKALVFDEGEGLRLKNVPRKARSSYSISVLFEFDAIDSYRRILAFGPNDRDEGLYIFSGFLNLYDYVSSAGEVAAADQWVRVHVTRQGKNGRMNLFVDGQKVATHLDELGEYKLRKGVAVFFQDNLVDSGTEEHPSGTAAGIKVWRGVKAP